jgi:hypothetical protein
VKTTKILSDAVAGKDVGVLYSGKVAITIEGVEIVFLPVLWAVGMVGVRSVSDERLGVQL